MHFEEDEEPEEEDEEGITIFETRKINIKDLPVG